MSTVRSLVEHPPPTERRPHSSLRVPDQTQPGLLIYSLSNGGVSSMNSEKVHGIYMEQLDRLVWVLREKYPRVLAANRRFEEETGWENAFGMNNLADALSHIGTLVTEAPHLDRERQAGQVTLFEDHLRRSMMEAWEQMLDFQLGEIDELWDQYLEEARPLQVAHKLLGAPTDREIDRLRIRHKHLLDQGREAKRAADWAGWETGTENLIGACATASELRQAVENSLAAAHTYRRERRRSRGQVAMWLLGLILSGAIGYGVAMATGDEEQPTKSGQEQRQRER